MAAPMNIVKMMTQLVICVSIIGYFGVLGDDFYDGQRTFDVEHCLDIDQAVPVFTKRGTVVVKSVKNNRAFLSEPVNLSTDDKRMLKNLMRANDIYRVRMQVRSTGNPDEDYVYSFTQACGIYESQLTDHLWIHFDQAGEVIGFSISTDPAQCLGTNMDHADLTRWNTTVDISQTVLGPAPDTQSYTEKIKREESEKSRGSQSDNRSFFAKYWMYIVPFVLIMMVASSADPQAAGGGS
ncbi:ER membrane protein complex subunit 10-like [Mizuhopecten yessoensis]|uniref:ER membrane protein complex subunit 10 n=1 Tax=Mizuhopecten yessoensis TaxID=6573 RepID=A0A210QUC5_MIZYE|nr:ER membrane protein complex subunit 10-like [Mizuhopecten yessoensis]OWF52353.1 ER membrane protein complex subunit 10 [Mizuhopecten yessoensis]